MFCWYKVRPIHFTCPFLSHWMVGWGKPNATHTNCAVCPSGINCEEGVGEEMVGGALSTPLPNSGSSTTSTAVLSPAPVRV